jgi:hypothetical protein
MITLATLPKATAQQVFNQVKRHLLKQGKRSTINGTSCRYRGDKDTKCAAGCLMSDKEYKRSFEGHGWRHLVDKGEVPNTHKSLIVDLQGIHDGRSPSNWENDLRSYAKAHGTRASVMNVVAGKWYNQRIIDEVIRQIELRDASVKQITRKIAKLK